MSGSTDMAELRTTGGAQRQRERRRAEMCQLREVLEAFHAFCCRAVPWFLEGGIPRAGERDKRRWGIPFGKPLYCCVLLRFQGQPTCLGVVESDGRWKECRTGQQELGTAGVFLPKAVPARAGPEGGRTGRAPSESKSSSWVRLSPPFSPELQGFSAKGGH